MLPGYSQQFKSFVRIAITEDDHIVSRRSGVDPPWATFIGTLIIPPDLGVGSEFGGTSLRAMHAFLEHGQPPVYVGWGSVKCGSSKQMFLLAVRALHLADCRGIVLGGWANLGLDALSGEKDESALLEFCKQNLLVMATAPHEVLFPRCSVVVHHGGIGTTTASLRSGKPTVITPVLYDQFNSANMVNATRVGIGGPHLSSITPSMLASYVTKCILNVEIKKNAEVTGAKIRSRDGSMEGLKFVKNLLELVQDGAYTTELDAWMDAKLKIK